MGAQAFLVRLAFFGTVADSAAAEEAGSAFLALLLPLEGVPLPRLDLPFLSFFVLEALGVFWPLAGFFGRSDPVLFPALSSFNSFAKCLQQDDPTIQKRGPIKMIMIPGINLPLKTLPGLYRESRGMRAEHLRTYMGSLHSNMEIHLFDQVTGSLPHSSQQPLPAKALGGKYIQLRNKEVLNNAVNIFFPTRVLSLSRRCPKGPVYKVHKEGASAI